MPTLGIDIGTQSLKAVLADDDLRVLGSGSVAYQPNFPRPGWAEQDPRVWLDALRPAIGQALAGARLTPSDVTGMAVCGQLDGCVPTAASGSALAPAIIWMDRRADGLLGHIDAAMISKRCGLVLDATHMGGKIAWFGANLPRRKEVAVWHQPVSFVVAALTGAAVVARSLASTTMLFDLSSQDWSGDLAVAFGASLSELPRLGGDAEIAAALTAAGSALTGLPAGLPVAVGTGDDFSNLLGGGIATPGVVGVSLGTAEAVGAISAKLTVDPQMLVETHAYPGGAYHLGNPGWLSGGAVRWASALLGVASDEAFMVLAAEAPAGCDGLVFLPALSGAMAPKWIAAARGSFVGLTSSHGRAHMARAVLEGNAFAMRDVIERLAELRVPTDRLRLMGGGARSSLWCRMRADITGRPADVVAEGDASAMGAALLAAVAVGRFADIPSAVTALPAPTVRIEPDQRMKPAYDDAYGHYREVFAALEPVWR